MKYHEFYNLLQKQSDKSIFPLLKVEWEGKNKQETLIRMFINLYLIPQFAGYTVCDGNFNKGEIFPANIQDFMQKSIKDKGDSADFVLMNDKTIIVGSSKTTCHGIGMMDVDKIALHTSMYPGKEIKYAFVVSRKKDLFNKLKKAESSSYKTRDIIKTAFDNKFIFDHADLNTYYKNFKDMYDNVPYTELIVKDNMHLRPHQYYTVMYTTQLLKENDRILWGHIARSGKSYMMAGLILQQSKSVDKCSYLIITLAPSETIQQYIDIFNRYNQFDQFNVITVNGSNLKPELADKNIIICSKQFLDRKVEKSESTAVDWMKEHYFDLVFIDESHYGGTTHLAKCVLDTFAKDSKYVFMTATYEKPRCAYAIEKKYQIDWGLEDIKCCKIITNPKSQERLIEKHGKIFKKLFIDRFTNEYVIDCYNVYPELHIITPHFNNKFKKFIQEETEGTEYGFSIESVLMLKHNKKQVFEKFLNEKAVLKLCYMIFGKYNKLGVLDKEYKDSPSLISRCNTICDRFDSRKFSSDHPLIIMCYLPCGNSKYPIDKLSKTFEKLLKSNNILPDYEIVIINSFCNSGADAKSIIKNAYNRCKNQKKKKGILVLSGKQCTLGVTLDDCDIVLMLNNNSSFDNLWQTSFRCMTEAKDKKFGFVIDCNIQRSCNLIYDYASKLYPKLTSKCAIKRVLEQKLITMDADVWLSEYFVTSGRDINTIVKNIMNTVSHNFSSYIKSVLDRLDDTVKLDNNNQNLINNIFTSTIGDKSISKKSVDELEGKDKDIKKGIESECDYKEIEIDDTEPEKDNDVMFVKDILKHMIPLLSVYTINNDLFTLEDMYHYVMKDSYLSNCLMENIDRRWNLYGFKGKITLVLNKVMSIYIEYYKDDDSMKEVIKKVKELFNESLSDRYKLSKLIDEYLIPNDNEKKNNAEIATPYVLRKDMLDKMPNCFWKGRYLTIVKKNGEKIRKLILPKIFEPCCGKGGFIVDIIDRLMDGLKEIIVDEKKRYKTIVENCIYFADINETNIYICRLLVDPYDQYKLNYHCGDTLNLDIKKKWNIPNFNAIIGNPPYNPNGGTGTGNAIWQKFVKSALNEWLHDKGYLLFVHPSGWRKPNTEKGKFYGLYDLMTRDNQMHYLSMHGLNDGKRIFKCGTRYDWYLIEKCESYMNTNIVDENGVDRTVKMSDYNWLPNYDIAFVESILVKNDEERCPIMYDRTAYGADKAWMSSNKNDVYKYPCLHSTPKSGVRYKYSKINDRGHFGVPKILFGESGINEPVLDLEGKYGITHSAMGIQIENKEEGEKIRQALVSDKFQKFLNSCKYSSYRIDWNLFKYMKREFWKKFIEV